MLLTITAQYTPATDIGFLFHKHPDRFQSVILSIGKAHIFYPEITENQLTIALLLDIDPIDLVRNVKDTSIKNFALGQYVNDRPYIASSFMSVAMSKAFSTAMNGACTQRPELVNKSMPFQVKLTALPAPKGGELLIRKLFEPLGYTVGLEQYILDEKFTDWGKSKYFTLTLSHTTTLKELLSHLYVLIPALGNDKHYFVNKGEIEKLLEKGKDWLPAHPEKEQITKRYLINLRSLTRQALEQLAEDEEKGEKTIVDKQKKVTLHQKRLELVLEQVKKTEAEKVIDLGCGEGKLLKMLLKDRQFKQITGMDISYQSLSRAKERMYWEEMSPKQKERIQLFQGALTYKDKRWEGYDVATVVEVIEHLDPHRLNSFERTLFEFAQPKTVVLTTPNREYNVLFEGMEAGRFRHSDHRFEWTRSEFETWANAVAKRNRYQVDFLPIGDIDEKVGAPSQMAIFKLITHH